MTQFWIIALLIALPGLLLLVPALLRPREVVADDLNDRNVRIARERLAELEAEKAAGTMSEEQFEQAKAELEGNLIDDLRDSDEQPVDAAPARFTLAAVFVLVPLVAVVLYLNVGSPRMLEIDAANTAGQAATQNPHPGGNQGAKPTMDEMLARLEEKLKANPENAEGWFVLGRSYMSEKRYPEAVKALEKAYELVGDHPNVLVSLADAVAMNTGGRISGRPEELLTKALKKSPDNTTALWLMGLAMQEQTKYKEAVQFWRRVLTQVQDDANTVAQLNAMIDKAMEKGGLTAEDVGKAEQPAETAGAEITVSVTLDETLKAEVSPGDTLFVMAKAPNGPPMPLAAVKLKASDLPADVKLNDSQAMMPDLKLSKFPRVTVQARIAKSGGATAQSGDMESDSVETVTSGKPSIKLVIGKKIP